MNTTMDFNRPYNLVYGSTDGTKYEQDGNPYDTAGNRIVRPKTLATLESMNIPTDSLLSAKDFLKHILQNGPVSKSKVYQIAGNNNQVWEDVTKAATELNLLKFQFKTSEMWKITEES